MGPDATIGPQDPESSPSSFKSPFNRSAISVSVRPAVYAAAELVIGNLNEEGYLTASDDELMGVAQTQVSEEANPPATSSPSAEAHSPKLARPPKV